MSLSPTAHDDPHGFVCYCFAHRVGDVQADMREHGHSTIAIAVTQACRAGLARCSEKNPAGTCCLGRLRSIARATAAMQIDCCNEPCDGR